MTDDSTTPTTSITLRDHFAAAALPGIISKRYGSAPIDSTQSAAAAREAYAVADALLTESAKAK